MRALVVLEVEQYDCFTLGSTRVVDVDPHDALATRQGAEAAATLRKGLQVAYSTLGHACAAVHTVLMELGVQQKSFYLNSYHALVVPQGGSAPWDPSRLGKHKNKRMWHNQEEESAFSPDLACCAIATIRPTEHVRADVVRVPVGQLRPFVSSDVADGAAMEMVRCKMQEGKHKGRANKRHRTLEDGEIDDRSQVIQGQSKKRIRKRQGPDRELTQVGRIVFVSEHLDSCGETTAGHVYEVVDQRFCRSEGTPTQLMLTLRVLKRERTLDCPAAVVQAFATGFKRAWESTVEAKDDARRRSLLLGLDRHQRDGDGTAAYAVLRHLLGGKASMAKEDAEAIAREMAQVVADAGPDDDRHGQRDDQFDDQRDDQRNSE